MLFANGGAYSENFSADRARDYMSACLCVYVCIYVCLHICIHNHMHIHQHINFYTHLHI